MKKIITSLSVIAIVIGLALGTLGATGAYFSDTATSTSNSFTAGTLDLKIANDGEPPYSDSVTGTFDASNMAPGDSETTGKVWLKNTGSVDADHVRITSVVNTPSDNGVNEPECKAYGGEWIQSGDYHYCIKVSDYDQNTCNSIGGTWDSSGSWKCYTREDQGFKDDWGNRNDIDKYLEITSIKYAGEELKFSGGNVVVDHAGHDSRADINNNGYLDLDDLETVAATEGSWLDNLGGLTSGQDRAFEMTVRLHKDADNHYQTDKDGIKITFQLNQDSSQ